MPSPRALDAHIVSHTHWDREWYHPVERFRQRLVALVDELLDDPPRADESFLLDGQSIIVEDYLAVRPDRAATLGALLARGKLEAGPWYVLADELIPSGEAIVRNLFAGRRVLRRFSASPPSVLYCPDSFGHPAVLPSIAAGFGFGLIVLWRGYGGSRWPAGDTVRWGSPTGEVFLYHLPRDGYEFGSHLPAEAAAVAERWSRMRAELAPQSRTGVVLIPHGADHHARQTDFREALSALEQAGKDMAGDNVHRSSLANFAEHLIGAAASADVPAVRGELRDSYGYTWCLQGTFGTRAHEKRLNAHAERLLVREAEPWSALAGWRMRDSRAARSGLLDAAWTTLLQAHPHDTLCGCSVDEVALAMEGRLLSATNQAEGIRDDALLDLTGHDRVAARTSRADWKPVVVVRNPAARLRSGVAILRVEQWLADVPVGPGSAPRDSSGIVPEAAPAVIPALGKTQTLASRNEYSLTESPRHYPDNDLVAVTEVAAWIPSVPPYGVIAWPIGEGTSVRNKPPAPATAERRGLENALLNVRIDDAGGVSLQQMATGRRIARLFDIVDERDVGDLYTPAPRSRAFAVDFRGARRVHRGPLRGEVALAYRVTDTDDSALIAELSVHLMLDAGAPFLRLVVAGENRSSDHRLRLAIHTSVPSAEIWADAAFGPVRRTPIVVSPEEAAVESPPRTAPLHRYVSAFAGTAGVTVFSDGLAEYEAADDGSLIVTLVRAVGELSRNDIPERPGHAGWPKPTPGAQCLGPFGAELGVLVHGARSVAVIDEIERTADDVLCPLVGTTLRSALVVPGPVTGPELRGTGLAVSAIKASEDGEWLVLRCVNLTDEPASGDWVLPFEIREAHLARLDETFISKLATAPRAVPVAAAPHAIVAILVR